MPEIPLNVMAWVAGVLLAVYVLFIFGALASRPRGHDPQRGQAVGCLGFVVLGLLGLGAGLAAGLIWDVPFLIRVPFWIVVFPAVSLVGSGIWHLAQKLRGR